MLDIPADKVEDAISASAALYAPLAREHVAYDVELTPAIAEALTGMGPSAHHVDTGRSHAADAPARTRVSIDVLVLTPR